MGAGGAGFPTHVKIGAKAEYIILNGAECEPLLRVDQQLLKLFADEIIAGLKVVVQAVGAKKGFICIKGKHKEIVRILEAKLNGITNLELFILDDFYPAGDEQILVYEVTKKVVPEAGIPINTGCIVLNAETVLNIYESTSNYAVTHKYLTITGEVLNPMTVKLQVGVSIRKALKIAGIENLEGFSVIDGGPMMGKVIENFDYPITKTTKGLILLKDGHPLIKRKSMEAKQAFRQSKSACLQCRMCTDLCPRYLLGHNIQPHLIMRKSNFETGDITGFKTASLCSECGVCELYACPVGLSPRLINVYHKKRLLENGIKYSREKDMFTASPIREYRKIPLHRLIVKLGLNEYDVDAPMKTIEYCPDEVKIPLKQHAGVPAVPIVTVGQVVEKGQLIGEIPDNSLGARVHSSISGRIKEISNFITIESTRGCKDA